jgi:ribosomal protein S18 acetylase RimI-like enzyme
VTTIRPATLQDLPGSYRVCLLTGDAGRDASGIYRNPDLLGHLYVGPFVVGEPELARVVADGEGIAGYLLAAADTRAFAAWAEREWWPVLRAQYPDTGSRSPDDDLIRLIHAPEPVSESILDGYPAQLHIDLLERVRGRGFGRRLVDDLIRTLLDRGTPGIHLDVAAGNDNAIAFYRHLGFAEIQRLESSLLMGRRL